MPTLCSKPPITWPSLSYAFYHSSDTGILLLLAGVMAVSMVLAVPVTRLVKSQPHYDIHGHSTAYCYQHGPPLDLIVLRLSAASLPVTLAPQS